jgi:hypothetical protein
MPVSNSRDWADTPRGIEPKPTMYTIPSDEEPKEYTVEGVTANLVSDSM